MTLAGARPTANRTGSGTGLSLWIELEARSTATHSRDLFCWCIGHHVEGPVERSFCVVKYK
jgi:hypothetical protein